MAEDASTIERPDVKVGDAWTYIVSELPTPKVVGEWTQEVVNVDTSTIDTEMRRGNGNPSRISYGRDWLNLRNPDFPVFNFPLEIGKKWTYARSYVSPQCGPSIDELTADVKGWEDIEVPAGKFRALRIEHNGTYKGSCGTGAKHHWYWYVPSVKRFVKYEQRVYARPGDLTVGELVVLKAFKAQ